MKRNLLTLAITLLVLFLAAETFLHVRAAKERARIGAAMHDRQLCTERAQDPRLIYTYTPGECGANSQGFRDVEHTFAKPKGVFRIALIGDSVADGIGVPADSAFGRVLERQLNARGDSLQYEVILLARIGYSTPQELVLLEDEAFRYDPDLILWSYCLNDPAHPIYHNANGHLGPYYQRPISRTWGLVKSAAFRYKRKMRGKNCPKEFHAFVHCAWWPEVEASIARIGEVTRLEGVPAVFIIHPNFENGHRFDQYSLRDVHANLRQAAQRNGMDVVDLYDAFLPYDPAVLKVNDKDQFDPWHMSARGHRVAAAAIEPHIP